MSSARPGGRAGRPFGGAENLQRALAKLHTYNSRLQFFTEQIMAIYELDGRVPKLRPGAWVADSAQVIGEVELGEQASVWFGVVIRGDTETIRIGRNSNIQDLSVLHADLGKPLTIGEDVTVGHQVMLHGCTIGDGSLIGIQAVVLNDAVIGRNCLVGAGSIVTEGKTFPDNSLILGSPARVVRTLDAAEIEKQRKIGVDYIGNAQRFNRGLKKIG
jgi:carbonic anhydrase/acetyltransferase-like protein (isoleucine patch superfamily)